MSIKVMSCVWDVPALKGSDKLVMLCLADHADDQGVCWPSIDTIARKSGISVSTVKSTLKKLEREGWLEKKNQFKKSTTGRVVRDSNKYQLAVAKLKRASEEQEDEQPAFEHSNSEQTKLEHSNFEQPESERSKPEHSELERSNFEQSKQEVFNSQISAGGRSESGYKPSLDPSVDPSLKDHVPSNELETVEPPLEAVNESPVFIELPLNACPDPRQVRESEIVAWSDMYPAVDIRQELRGMLGWLQSHPRRRKTKQGVDRFIHNWLRNEQDKGYVQTRATGLSPSEEFRQHLQSQGRPVNF